MKTEIEWQVINTEINDFESIDLFTDDIQFPKHSCQHEEPEASPD